jgi:hypothetical protein
LHKWDCILTFVQLGLCDIKDIEWLKYHALHTGRISIGGHYYMNYPYYIKKGMRMGYKERNIYREVVRWIEYRYSAINPNNSSSDTRSYWKQCRRIRQRLVRMVNNYYNYIHDNYPE